MTDRQGVLPPIAEILEEPITEAKTLETQAQTQARLIEKTLADFGLKSEVRDVRHGPRLTQFGLKPGSKTQISKIKRLEADLGVALSGSLVQIEEPTPTYPYLTLVVENYRRPRVKLRQVLESPAFGQKEGSLKVGLGLDQFGQPVIIDLAALPHLLIGGTTGSGKSVCVNGILASLLCTYTPASLRLLLIDPAAVELTGYDGLPHLIAPVITQTGPVLEVLNNVIQAIDQRFQKFAQLQVRNIAAYNHQAAQTGEKPLPYVVIIIDNLVDLMLDAPEELEQVLTRIAQKARAAGVHLILATLRTNVSTLAGTIKANFPGRIAFKMTDNTESQLILDAAGAEYLLGEGDMFFKAPQTNHLVRIQGVYPSEVELKQIVRFWQEQT